MPPRRVPLSTVQPDPISTLTRWTESGAMWRVVSRRPGALTVGLFRCDGGEEVERITSSSPELIAFVGNRSSSEDEE